MKKSIIFSLIFVLCLVGYAQQITIEKTIPEAIKLEGIRQIVIYPVYIIDTDSYQWRVETVLNDGQKGNIAISTFWMTELTPTQRAVIKGFIKLVARLCLNVAADKVTGEAIEN